MPSPFPGMDPYLEDPELWRGVHNRLIVYLADDLNVLLPSRYFANVEERVVIEEPRQNMYPDIQVVKRRSPVSVAPARRPNSAARETSAVVDPPLLISVEPVELAETYVEIKTSQGKRLITSIEILSPPNKATASSARAQYLTIQRRLLPSSVHLLEVNLLRRGAFTAAVPLSLLEFQTDWDYLLALQRGGHNQCEIWPVLLPNQLPRIHVPLSGRDADVILDLQKALDQCYDAGRYAEQFDYQRDPPVPLPTHYKTWANELLRAKGLRRTRKTGGRS